MIPRRPNGLFTKWALGLLAAGILGLGGWAGNTLLADGVRITTLETKHEDFSSRLERIEQKLDRLIERANRP